MVRVFTAEDEDEDEEEMEEDDIDEEMDDNYESESEGEKKETQEEKMSRRNKMRVFDPMRPPTCENCGSSGCMMRKGSHGKNFMYKCSSCSKLAIVYKDKVITQRKQREGNPKDKTRKPDQDILPACPRCGGRGRFSGRYKSMRRANCGACLKYYYVHPGGIASPTAATQRNRELLSSLSRLRNTQAEEPPQPHAGRIVDPSRPRACPHCGTSGRMVRKGLSAEGKQRYGCVSCAKLFVPFRPFTDVVDMTAKPLCPFCDSQNTSSSGSRDKRKRYCCNSCGVVFFRPDLLEDTDGRFSSVTPSEVMSPRASLSVTPSVDHSFSPSPKGGPQNLNKDDQESEELSHESEEETENNQNSSFPLKQRVIVVIEGDTDIANIIVSRYDTIGDVSSLIEKDLLSNGDSIKAMYRVDLTGQFRARIRPGQSRSSFLDLFGDSPVFITTTSRTGDNSNSSVVGFEKKG
eukprot:TRINITY_DN847_c1_g2_i2.p1 TRINITY_DN847_c1_g2~~TRINITY_DN847_c1_g2_i2.p1  ORF type:complete len:462 (+),score=108.70 TRINITY_DN847_c1_g2_i2:191-1576(+)